mmetsp:Transcript_17893/g.43795  ORF Transcript_17893/g.43795 Transcript_17893/m.43795 type:complete len:237 (+) Transcript_17893:211-921(+)
MRPRWPHAAECSSPRGRGLARRRRKGGASTASSRDTARALRASVSFRAASFRAASFRSRSWARSRACGLGAAQTLQASRFPGFSTVQRAHLQRSSRRRASGAGRSPCPHTPHRVRFASLRNVQTPQFHPPSGFSDDSTRFIDGGRSGRAGAGLLGGRGVTAPLPAFLASSTPAVPFCSISFPSFTPSAALSSGFFFSPTSSFFCSFFPASTSPVSFFFSPSSASLLLLLPFVSSFS